MELAEFHLFPNLPKELRDLIWESAIRPDRPSAHFFTLCYDGKESMRTQVLANWASRYQNWKLQLSCPQFSSTAFGSYSWTDGNPSAYLLDSGLWTACRESRDAMRRYHRLGRRPERDAEEAAPETTPTGPRALPRPTLACSKGLIHDRFLTVDPARDLLCIQPELTYAPISKTALAWIPLQNFQDFQNIAIEFSSSGFSGLTICGSSPSLHWLNFALRKYGRSEAALWLIDYTLRPTRGRWVGPGARAEPFPGRAVFYGHDRRYVEVIQGDDAWSRPPAANPFDLWGSPEELAESMGGIFARPMRILAVEVLS
ncbi:hypothetical protein GQ53DRAFT_463394 [Thozetella sp. PMI_491]|nr:hypothetical protein GQ53DRAFT_463394 [Thozetella sp. PMI_491]